MTHLCVSDLTTIGSDNGLSPGRRQAIIWTDARILLTGPLGINFSEILIEIHTFSLKKMYLKMSSAKGRLFRLGLNVLTPNKGLITHEAWARWQAGSYNGRFSSQFCSLTCQPSNAHNDLLIFAIDISCSCYDIFCSYFKTIYSGFKSKVIKQEFEHLSQTISVTSLCV